MKPISLILFLLFTFLINRNTNASNTIFTDSLNNLRKEIIKVLSRTGDAIAKNNQQQFAISFLINAKNEIVVIDVNGNGTEACNAVRDALNFKKIKYNQAKQLTMYSITVEMINNE